MIVFRTSSIFFALPIQTCRSNDFFILKAKMHAPKKSRESQVLRNRYSADIVKATECFLSL